MAQEIIVTSPNGGELWEIWSVQYVQWTAADTSNGFKITLLKDGVSLGAIGIAGPSDRSFRWEEVGRHQNGMASSGSGYTIKVKEQRTDISDEGDASFTLTDPPPCDLVVTDIFTNDRGKVIATVKNQGAPLNKKVLLKAEVPGVVPSFTRLTPAVLNLGTNSSRNVIILPAGDLFRRGGCRLGLLVTVDPHDDIFETNNENNSIHKTVFRNSSHDGKLDEIYLGGRHITDLREVFIEASNCLSQTGDDFRIFLRVHLINCGATDITNGTLRLIQYYKFEERSTGEAPPRTVERRVTVFDTPLDTMEAGVFSVIEFEVTLKRKFSDWVCRKNTLILEFLCAETGAMAVNNKKKFILKFSGF
jgi:hypothetical protein